VAFGMFTDSTSEWRTALLVVLSAPAVVFIQPGMLCVPKSGPLAYWGLTLVLAAPRARLRPPPMGSGHRLPDFYVRDHHWHTFNIADSAIVIRQRFGLIWICCVETAGDECILRFFTSRSCTRTACWSR